MLEIFRTLTREDQLACRVINKALTGPSAKRRLEVDGTAVNEAWEALERCWEEFDSLKYDSPNALGAYRSPEDIIRYVLPSVALWYPLRVCPQVCRRMGESR